MVTSTMLIVCWLGVKSCLRTFFSAWRRGKRFAFLADFVDIVSAVFYRNVRY
jgi:hypothetical protein